MSDTIKILHLEDSLSDAELVERELKESNLPFEKLVVANEKEYLNALTAFAPDIILSDHTLPSFDSIAALSMLRKYGLNIPFIIVTATIPEEFAVKIIKLGAADYILKDRLRRLPVAIESALEKRRFETERETFSEEIDRNEKHYRALIENIHDAIILVNEKGELIYRSPSTRHIIGYKDTDRMGKKIFDLVPAEDLPLASHLFQQAAAKPGTPLAGQFRIKHRNGHLIWLEGTIINLLHDESVKAYILNYRDISDRKKAELQLEASEKFSKGVLDSLTIQLAVVDIDGTIIAVNKAWDNFAFDNGVSTLKGVSFGSNYFDVCKAALENGESVALQTMQGMQSVFRKEIELFKLEYPCHSPVKQRWFMMQVMPFGNDGTKVITTHQDITERKEAEANLQAIFNNTSEGFVLTDLKGGIKLFNEKASEVFQLNSGKVLEHGLSIFEYVQDSMKAAYQSAIPGILSGGDIQYDLSFEMQNGHTYWFIFTITAVYNNGVADGFSITAKDITARKYAEQTLSRSEAGYRQIVETAQEGIWLVDDEANTTFVNKKMGEILGYDPEEMLGRTIYDFMDEAGKQQAARDMEKRRNGIGGNVDQKYITKSGKQIWTNISANPIFDADGKYQGTLGMISDVTEKKNLEDLLDKASMLARVGHWEIDVVNNTVYWSDITKEIREVPPDFVPDLYTGISYFKEGHSKQTIAERVQDCIANGKPWDEELEIFTHKGNLKWVRSIGEGEFINGKCIRVYGSFQDIDARKKAELEVLKVYEEKNTILESIGDGFFAIDNKWIVTYWNQQSEKMLRKTRAEILGQSMLEVYAHNIDSPFHIYFKKAMNENSMQHFEAYSDKLSSWFELSAFPSASGGLSVYFKDITQRKLSEIKLNELNRSLQQSAKELAISNKELEQFAYVVSHDLQEPLRMVASFLTNLEKKYSHVLDDKGREYIHFAVDGAKRMRQIILDLLEFSKTGKMEDKLEEVDLNELAEEVLVLYRKQINEKKAVVEIDKLPVLLTAKSPLRQVFQNLISNSLKYYVEKDGKPLVIRISSGETGTHWQFSIADNGIGISPEFFDKIFIVFHRLHSKEDYSGTGMGLAITKKIVENLGGKIWVESEEGKGSVFYFTIAKPFNN